MNAPVDSISCKPVTRSEGIPDFRPTKIESFRSTIPAATGRLTRLIDANMKVASDFYSSHKQIAGSVDDSSSYSEKVAYDDYSYGRTKPDVPECSNVTSGRPAFRRRLSGKVTLDKFFGKSKYSRRLMDRPAVTYGPVKSLVCRDSCSAWPRRGTSLEMNCSPDDTLPTATCEYYRMCSRAIQGNY